MKGPLQYVVGTGGVGIGILFQLLENRPLGRNESRPALLTEARDFCKLHIILHYVALFGETPVYAISCVGNDENGTALLRIMNDAGIHTDFVRTVDTKRTMYSVCYQFPDGAGGNLTSCNGANDLVSEEDVARFFASPAAKGAGMVLAAPEVPLASRLRLLREGRARDCFNVASVLCEEVVEFNERDGFSLVDLLAINRDEAQAIAALSSGRDDQLIRTCKEYLFQKNPEMILVITLGDQGSYTCFHDSVLYTPAIQAPVVNTAGAGDCFLGTMMAGLLCGLPVLSDANDPQTLSTAQELASLAAAKKVGAQDSIDFTLDREALYAFAGQHQYSFSPEILKNFLRLSN